MDEDYLRRAELIRERLLKRAAREVQAQSEEVEKKKKKKRAEGRPGSLTQKLKPILGRIGKLTEESHKIERKIRESSGSSRRRPVKPDE